MEELLYGQRNPAQKAHYENQKAEGLTRAERIARHNASAEQLIKMSEKRGSSKPMACTHSFESKHESSAQSLGDLVPMLCKDLRVGLIHHGKALYCTVVAKATFMNSVQTLVEDAEGHLIALAVYNAPRVRDIFQAQRYLRVGRKLAVKEPLYKLRADGTEGIRIDDPEDVVLDIEAPVKSVEQRIRDLLEEDATMGQQRLREALKAEGFSIGVQRLRKLLAVARDQPPTEGDTIPVAVSSMEGVAAECAKGSADDVKVPDRQPDQHRYLVSTAVRQHREQGNTAIKSGQFAVAEGEYSKAIESAEQEEALSPRCLEDEDSIALWTLYSNRSAARVKLGRPDEGFKDALRAHECAPIDAAKPYLRLAEALHAMHRHEAASHCLKSASEALPSARDEFERKAQAVQPTKVLHVGIDQEFQSLSKAVDAAPAGAEILVHPGVYREPLLLVKPVTIRAICALVPDRNWVHGAPDGSWVEVWVQGCHAVSAHTPTGSVCLEGLRIICEGDPKRCFHSLLVERCTAVVRNCSLSDLSGPIAAADHSARLIMEDCAIHDGTQGGILVDRQSMLVLSKVRCCRALHSVELRQGSTATINESEFFANEAQALIIWHGAGRVSVLDTDVHSNRFESGVMVQENPNGACFESCRFFGNGYAGIVVQQGGRLQMKACEVFSNFEGILIQDRCSAMVERCKVHDNSNGIFIGYDHIGEAELSHNSVFDNCTGGIILGTGGKKVKLSGNEETANGLAPGLHGFGPNLRQDKTAAKRDRNAMDMRRWAKNMQKSGGSARKAAKATSQPTFLDFAARMAPSNLEARRAEQILACAFCKASPDGRKFQKCSQCQAVSYCSHNCQKAHWKAGHKKMCRPVLEHPSFIDPHRSVDDRSY